MNPLWAQPSIVLRNDSAYDRHSIQVIRPTASDFTPAIQSLLNNQPVGEELSEALPYSIIVKNVGKRPIAVVGFRLELESHDGKTVPQIYVAHHLHSGAGLKGLEPGGAGRLFSPFSAANAIAAGTPSPLPLGMQLRQDLDTNGVFLREQKIVTVALDAVVFVDGGLIGPDRNGLEKIVRAWLDAEQDVVRSVIQRVESGQSSSAIIAFLRTKSEQVVRGDHRNGTWDHYTATQNASATALADVITRSGIDLSKLRGMLRTAGIGQRIASVRREE